MTTLHFIMDPQCGWCYAAVPLIDALTELSEVQIKTHGGGLFSGANKGAVTAEFRQHMLASDKRIMALTGQQFSDTYYRGIFADKTRILDSDTPITALLAAESLGIQPLTMLHQIQRAQFIEGSSMSDINSLTWLATQLGTDSKSFVNAFAFFSGEKTNHHIAQSRHLMRVVGGNGFPTFAVEHKDGTFTRLDHGSFYSTPKLWSAYVEQIVKEIS